MIFFSFITTFLGGSGSGFLGSGGVSTLTGGAGLRTSISTTLDRGRSGTWKWIRPNAIPTWAPSAPMTAMRSTFENMCSLLRRVGVERELMNAQRLHEIYDVHHVAVGDALVGVDDGLQILVLRQQLGDQRLDAILVDLVAV